MDKGALLHAIVGAALVAAVSAVALLTGQVWIIWAALAASTIGWPVREALQRRRKGHADIWDFSRHKRLEAFAPVASGAVVALIALAAI